MEATQTCINCNRRLIKKHGVMICLQCNSDEIDSSNIFINDNSDGEYIFIECPGATLYQDGTNEIIAGVKFYDKNHPEKGYEIIKKPVYAPTHKKKRRIKKEGYGKISRCQGCQDYTIRMRRREGADFFIPSTKYPNRKKLKRVQHVVYEP